MNVLAKIRSHNQRMATLIPRFFIRRFLMSYHVKGWEAESLIKEILAEHEGFVSPECSIEVSLPALPYHNFLLYLYFLGYSRRNS